MLKGDIMNKNRREDKEVERIQLTADEIEVLMTIGAIMEFEKENPGNIPQGGVGEVIVSSDIMEAEIFNETAQNLCEFGLLDDEYLLTDNGRTYLEQMEHDLQLLKENKEADCGNDYTKVSFGEVKNYIKTSWDKINWNEVSGICSIALLILDLVK